MKKKYGNKKSQNEDFIENFNNKTKGLLSTANDNFWQPIEKIEIKKDLHMLERAQNKQNFLTDEQLNYLANFILKYKENSDEANPKDDESLQNVIHYFSQIIKHQNDIERFHKAIMDTINLTKQDGFLISKPSIVKFLDWIEQVSAQVETFIKTRANEQAKHQHSPDR